MRAEFVQKVLHALRVRGELGNEDTLLAVCSGEAERDLFAKLGLSRVVLTSLDPVVTSGVMAPFEGKLADVRGLPFPDKTFDFVFVSDGLHHCDSPHRALCEMYRVSRKAVIVFESRDSLTMRLSVAIGMADKYEVAAVEAGGGRVGGVNFSAVPNFVYRWTEREFEKTIACADPSGLPTFSYFYGLNLPARSYKGVRSFAYRGALLVVRLIAGVFPRQANSFCLVGRRPSALFPWLERDGDVLRFNSKWRQ